MERFCVLKEFSSRDSIPMEQELMQKYTRGSKSANSLPSSRNVSSCKFSCLFSGFIIINIKQNKNGLPFSLDMAVLPISTDGPFYDKLWLPNFPDILNSKAFYSNANLDQQSDERGVN